MSASRRLARFLIVSAIFTTASGASAQTLGVFRWQLQPYCNVLSLTVTQNGSVYTLDGTDDQCGTGPAAVSGEAFLRPGGLVGLGLTIVATPGGTPVHLDASIGLGTLSGAWQDSAGHQGPFTFTPGAGAGGTARPPGGLGAGAVDTTQLQLRITGVCPVGQLMAGVNQDGSVSCRAVADSGGDITSVTAGFGLIGGGTAGAVTLMANFGGSGVQGSMARSDHTHEIGGGSTAIGAFALLSQSNGGFNLAAGDHALGALTTGDENVAVGASAMNQSTIANYNTAVGTAALRAEQNGDLNTGLGWNALYSHNGGAGNVAVGAGALRSYPTGAFNTAIGYNALINLSTGTSNTAVGIRAGISLGNGSQNLYLANPGLTTESNTIRLGDGIEHNRLFLAGTRGITTGQANAIPIMIDGAGQVGTISSSRRTKKDIADLGDFSREVHRLHPVQFRYSKPFSDGTAPIQYGLIAEEVEEVFPQLVAYGADGRPETVMYHVLPTLLLAEVQRLERARVQQEGQLQRQADELGELRALLQALRRELASTPRR